MTTSSHSQDPSVQSWYASRKPKVKGASTHAAAGATGMIVAIQGEPGSFSHEAAMRMVPQACIQPHALSAEVFAALAEGDAEAAVIPIENSLAGSVSEHFDLLLNHDVCVQAESLLRIRHNLIAMPGVALGDIRRVFSHPVALAQCRRYLAAHPHMEAFGFYDTAGSVKQLMELGDRDAAGIASQTAAQYYGAHIVAADIEDNPENYTRFFLVQRSAYFVADLNANKVSLAFSLENRPGSLVSALQELAALGTNLTKIESRPVHGKPWEYIFYVDAQLDAPDQADRAMAALQPHCAMLKRLGLYREMR